MRLQPRHYLLIVLIISLGAYNFYRVHRLRQQQATTAVTVAPTRSTDTTSEVVAAWAAYDHAATLRDAPGDKFQPALAALDAAKAALPAASHDANADLEGCRLYLISYHSHALTGPNALHQSSQHIDRCVQLHRDAAY
jgi:predicted negative regulator of RcsB-dependent stress response